MHKQVLLLASRKCGKVLPLAPVCCEAVVRSLQGAKRSSSSLLAQRRQLRSQSSASSPPLYVLEASTSSVAAAPIARTRTASIASSVEKPSTQALRALFVASAVPMIGFGFMDNLVMIQAGQYIDSTLGVQLGLATMTAAAAGQVISDVSGVLFGGSLERVLSPYIPDARLTPAQRALPISGYVRLAGAVGGVILGCTLGAMTLWTVDLEARDRQEKLEKMTHIADDFQRLHPQVRVHWAHQEHSLIKDSLLNRCLENRELLLGQRGEKYCVCVPIAVGSDQHVVGVVEYFAEELDVEPSHADIEKARVMASHLAIIHSRLD